MDLQIIKGNEKIKLSEIGVHVRDIIVSSIELEPVYQSVEGANGRVDYDAVYKNRTIDVDYYFEAHDNHDFPLLRDKFFDIVNSKLSFYIRPLRFNERLNEYVSGKRYLVRVDSSFTIDQNYLAGLGEMKFETTELPFAESIGTTSEIDTPEIVPLSSEIWEKGYFGTSDGGNEIRADYAVRYPYKQSIKRNTEYNIKANGDYGLVVRIYDKNDNYLKLERYDGNGGKKITTPSNAYFVRLYITSYDFDKRDLEPSMVGKSLKAYLHETARGIKANQVIWGFEMGLLGDDDGSLVYTHTGKQFDIYNAGIEIHPFEQDIIIEISEIVGSSSYFQLENRTTGDKFRVTEKVTDDKIIKIDGANVTMNGTQFLRKTNKKYITLDRGWNKLYITGADTAKVSFDFRYYYI